MASYDYSYISMLLHDMNLNDSTAYAAFYAATCQSVYKFMVSRLGSSYMAQDAMQKLYEEIFQTDSYPERTPRAFISYFEKEADRITSDLKGTNAQAKEGKASEEASPVFDSKDADLMLTYIFQSAHMERDEYSFETLLSYSNYRIRRRNLQKILLVIIIIIGALIPTILIRPKLDLEATSQVTSNGHAVYHAEVSTLYPVDSLNATMQGRLMPVTVNPDGTYLIYPLASGSMTVTATLMTARNTTVTIEVD